MKAICARMRMRARCSESGYMENLKDSIEALFLEEEYDRQSKIKDSVF